MMHAHMIFALTPIIALSAPTLAGDDPIFACDPPQIIGALNGFNSPTLMTIDENYAYIVDDSGDRLSIVDLSDATNPTLLSSIEVSYGSQSIKINGDAAYLLYNNYFTIYNIEDKADPWFRRTFPISNSDDILPLSNAHIFFNEYALNIERPFAPGIDRYDITFPFNEDPAYVQSNVLYTENLSQYDITDPQSPTLIFDNTPNTGGTLSPRTTRYEFPYFISTTDGAVQFALQTPGVMATSINQVPLPTMLDATVRSGLIYATTYEDTLEVFNPVLGEPFPVASFGTDDGMMQPRYIRQLDDYFVILGENALAIYEIPTNPIASIETTGPATYIAKMDNIAFLGTERLLPSDRSVSAIDITNPSIQLPLGDAPAPTQNRASQGIATLDTTLLVADDTLGLNQYEYADPNNPVLIASYDTGITRPQRTRDIDLDIENNLALVADARNGVISYAINPDRSLTQIGLLETGDTPQRVTILGDIAFVCTNIRAYIVDISDPTQMTLLSTLESHGGDLPNYLTADRVGDFLYTAEFDNGYRILDISDPTDPIELAQFDADVTTNDGTSVAFAYDIRVENDLLYLAASSGGFTIYDNTNIFAPVVISHIPSRINQGGTIIRFRDFIKAGDTLYIAAGDSGLRTYSFDGCSLPCAIDYNNDGALDFFDVTEFIQRFTSEDFSADLNNDDELNFFDVTAFIVAFQNGCP